jgi:crotonobetainyl-CoA:carnitine CoA-transferase CaiB-like acyl-CoA transferase
MSDDGVLAGFTVANFSNNLIGAHIAQLFADFGAEVFWVEPPGGSPLRSQAAWPVWARGAKSVVLDLHDVADNATACRLAARADVLIETSRPGVMERLGLGYDELAAINPRLVYTSVTGFGRNGPLARMKAYEGIVMAKLGAYTQFSAMVDRDGPAFAIVPYGSATAALVALQGTLVALLERERSGAGQRVDTTLVQGFNAHDVFFWIMTYLVEQTMAAMAASPTETEPVPASPPAPAAPARPSGITAFALMAGLTSDGHWLQFSQSTPKQSAAFVHAVGLDDEYAATMASGDPERIAGFTRRMHEAVHARTLAEWGTIFDEHPDVFAEVYRSGTQLLHHPQLVHDGRVVEVDGGTLGRIREPGPLVVLDDTPGRPDQPPPELDEHRSEMGILSPSTPNVNGAPVGRPPLEGVTVLELATFYAAPYGSTMLADLGARVIKVEQPDGDPLRWLLPFPEAGGVKVLAGKESVAVDMHTDEGREIVYELARRSDIVLQSFRSGVAERLRIDSASLRAVCPDLSYHDGPGFGVGGPYGHRPAYAPTIGAGSGMARRNTGPDIPERPDLTIDEIMRVGARLVTSNAAVGQADGFAAVAVGAALALGLLARELRGEGQRSETACSRRWPTSSPRTWSSTRVGRRRRRPTQSSTASARSTAFTKPPKVGSSSR